MITIYTPTYNRAYRLPDLYKSLLKQTNQNFQWLILDDGSTDNTKELVGNWIEKNEINIKYQFHDNIGKQATVNKAHEIIDTVLNVCIDSDDYLLDDSIEIIISEWSKISNKDIAGLVGLDIYKNGSLVGTNFPTDIDVLKFSEFKKNNIYGDKKFIYRTDIIKKYKYPQIKNEKFPAPGYIYRLIDQKFHLKLVNKPLCVVEYLDDGISKNKFKQLKKNPNSFLIYREERIRMALDYKDLLLNYFHLGYTCIYAKKNPICTKSSLALLILILPISAIYFLYIEVTNKKGVI
jgi:glycosyltransferase involved in cell wall biosynthesis